MCVLAGDAHVGLVPTWEALIAFSQEIWKSVPAKRDVLKGVEEEDAQNDGEKAADCSNHSIHAHIQPFLEENGGAGHDRSGEEHVVDGGDYRRVEDVQGFVQVADLNGDTDHQADD